MKTRPLKSDKRYSINLEYCGYEEPRYVLRFCDEWVDSFAFYSSALMRAVGESNLRRGAIPICEERGVQ